MVSRRGLSPTRWGSEKPKASAKVIARLWPSAPKLERSLASRTNGREVQGNEARRRAEVTRMLLGKRAVLKLVYAALIRAAEHHLTLPDSIQLELLRKGLDGITPPRG